MAGKTSLALNIALSIVMLRKELDLLDSLLPVKVIAAHIDVQLVDSLYNANV